ncbi:hypothetical protein C8Z91_32225 [Paenibacillus elgii]|uniref:Uncharacterized protein n=1 Tax=Paenibacillus elgii TaxID=189691 RepID=A0A2T6FTP4_9BACL|nr:hypothetical protein C8Z91_32225 [Paenibacillus elgii]
MPHWTLFSASLALARQFCTTVFSIEELQCVIVPDIGALCKIEELPFAITPISRIMNSIRHN